MKCRRILILCMCAVMLLMLPVHAAEKPALNVQVEHAYAVPGDLVIMTFSLKDYTQDGDLIRGIQLVVSGIDPSVLDVESCRSLISAPDLPEAQNLATWQAEKGVINLIYAPLKNTEETDDTPLNELLEIQFRVKDNPNDEDVALQIREDVVYQSGPDRTETTVSAPWSSDRKTLDFHVYSDEPEIKNGMVDGYYYVDNVKTYAGLIQIGDDLYYIDSRCQMVKNRSYYVSKTNGLLPAGKYSFDADGKLIMDAPAKNGIVKETETDWYYYVDGVKVYAGLVEIDGSLYYVNSAFQVIHGKDYYVSKTNGIKPQGVYTFDAEGKLVEKDTSLSGIVKDGDTWYYYVDGVKTYAGLVEIDGALYYVKSDKTVVHGQEYYVSKTNDLKPAGKYGFGPDGKLLDYQGIVKDGDVWTYYVNGSKAYAGLIEIDGALYYVRSDCTVVHGQDYYVSKTNGLKDAGKYSFDADGKLVQLNGIVKDGDVWTYYVNGAKTYAGLIEIDGDYYYVKSDCTVVHGQSYAVSKTNGLMPQGTYTFDDEGKMI